MIREVPEGSVRSNFNETKMKGKIEEQVEEVRLAVEGALSNPAIMRKLERFGYTQKEMKVGRGLINNVELLTTNQEDG